MRRAAVRPGGARRRARDARALRRGHVGLVRRDDRPRERAPDRRDLPRRPPRGADVDDQHRRVHVERGRRRAARLHRPRRARPPGRADDRDARADGAPRADRPVLQLVRPPQRREARDLASDRRAADPDPLVGRQRLARDRAADRPQHDPEPRGTGRRAVRLDGLRLLLRAVAQPGPVPLRAVDRPSPVLLRHRRLGEPDRGLHRDGEGRAPAQDLLRALAQLPRHAATGAGRRRARRASTATTRA